MSDMPRCPRCNSEDVVRGGPHHTEFECRGSCAIEYAADSNRWEYVYFQYDKDDEMFCWPAVDLLYKCSANNVKAVREGKMKPDFV